MIVTLMTCEVHGRRGILTIRDTPEVGMLHFEHHYDDGLELRYMNDWPLNLVCAAELDEDDEDAWLCDRELSIWVWDWPDSDLEDDYEEEEEDE